MSIRSTGFGDEMVEVKLRLEEYYRQRRASKVAHFQWCFDAVGYRIRPPFTLDMFADFAEVIGEGLFVRGMYSDEYTIPYHLKLDGDAVSRAWSLHSIALVALADVMFEPDLSCVASPVHSSFV